MELEFSRQIFLKIFMKSLPWELSCSLRTDGRTWRS